jgi:signal transduction histidine kinase
MPLQKRILLYTSVLMLSLLAAVFLYVNYRAERFVNEGIAADLARGRREVTTAEEERLSNLRLTAGLVASFPELKALLATDVRTIRDFLIHYQQQNPRAELLFVLDTAGKVVARTDLAMPEPLPHAKDRWIEPLLAGRNATGILDIETGLYHAAAMPAEAGGRLFGFVIAGARINDAFAAALAETSQSEILIATDHLIGSSLKGEGSNSPLRLDWKQSAQFTEAPSVVTLAGTTYAALATQLGREGGPRPVALLLKSRDQALAPYRGIRTGLLFLVFLVTVAAVFGSALLARSVTAPIAKLVDGTKQVATGNLDFQLDIHRSDELGELAGSFNRMILERKRLEEQFRQAQKMEAVGRLAGGVAHDFNNLLTAIGGFGQLVYEALDPKDALRDDVLQIIKAGERATSLTRQLLAFSRRQFLLPKVFSLNDVVVDMQKMLERLVGADIQLVTVLEPKLGRIKADPGQLEQVLLNLVVNARDAMPNGGQITITTSNLNLDHGDQEERPSIPSGRYTLLTVEDAGTGMTEEVRSHLFEPFFTTKETGKGTGLGLATVYGITQQSNGHIVVESELGHGSTFKIHLPQTDEEDAPSETHKAAFDDLSGSETILVAEDEDALRGLAVQVLRGRGYTVLETSEGAEALAVCEALGNKIDLILTDVVMPKMSGTELAEKVASLYPDIKVLYMSGYQGAAIFRHGEINMETVYLQKPFTPAVLADKVRRVLDA